MSMQRTRRLGAVTIIAAGAAFAAAATANAGHENAVLEADLSGANEVGEDGELGVGDTDGAGVAYVFGIDEDPTTLCYAVTATGIDPTFVPMEVGMAHIHRGTAEENGPVVAALAFPLEGDSADCLTEGEEGKFPLIGEEGEPESIVADILANPEGYYVNVHTGEFPDGAIRGQLRVVDEHMHVEPTGTTAPADSTAPAGSTEPAGTMADMDMGSTTPASTMADMDMGSTVPATTTA